MDWQKIDSSEFNEIFELLDISFPVSRPILQDDLNQVIKNPRGEGIIHRLKVNDQIIGTAAYGRLYDDEYWNGEGIMRYWAVHPDHRRKGYGTWILNKVMSDLRNAGSPCMVVAILSSNRTIRAFYERLGFTEYAPAFIDEDVATQQIYGEHSGYVKWFEKETID